MSLKTFVKVGNVSNLSDARYCAGMGVDVIGFNVNPASESYVSPEEFKEIVGWVAGVEFCLEASGTAMEQLEMLTTAYDFTHVQSNDLQVLNNLSDRTKILQYHVTSEADLPLLREQIDNSEIKYVLLECIDERLYTAIDEAIQSFQTTVKLIKGYNLTPQNLSAIGSDGFSGISLKGTAEIRPGYKDFDQLADILEALEVD